MPENTTQTKTPIKVRKLGHLVYEVSDVDRSTAFWTDIMGFSVSDRNEFGMVFLRSAGDHHSIALVPAKKVARPPGRAGCSSTIWRWKSPTSTCSSARASSCATAASRSPTKAGADRAATSASSSRIPDGYTFEIYADMDQVGSDGKSRPPEQWSRAGTLEEAFEKPLPAGW